GKLGEKGNLYAVMTDTDFRLTDWNSKILWRTEGRFHHDVDISETGEVYTLARKDERVPFEGREIRILNDYITVLDPSGNITEEVSLYSLVQDLIPREVMLAAEKYAIEKAPGFLQNDTPSDIFHTNTIQHIAKDDSRGVFQEGDVLIGIRELNAVVVVDLEKKTRVWEWGKDELQKPHHPHFLSNGHILVFDNGVTRGYSRILEFNPASNKIVWSYGEKESERFYSAYRGGAQRLANGNTLIAIGEAGEAIEVTPTGEKVWHFQNPRWKNEKKKLRETLYRITRVVGAEGLLSVELPFS
ncbi:MAG: aryl-sulfate sulfotransferase, partial [Bdellovibrionales bacterium]|nr:aryl-sulfate sulfotransferase [Bdellovibrionales bacterium]